MATASSEPDWKAAYENVEIAHEGAIDRYEKAEAEINRLNTELERVHRQWFDEIAALKSRPDSEVLANGKAALTWLKERAITEDEHIMLNAIGTALDANGAEKLGILWPSPAGFRQEMNRLAKLTNTEHLSNCTFILKAASDEIERLREKPDMLEDCRRLVVQLFGNMEAWISFGKERERPIGYSADGINDPPLERAARAIGEAMKNNPHQTAKIKQFCTWNNRSVKHWWVIFSPPIYVGDGKQCGGNLISLDDARRLALRYCYARNIEVDE